MVVGEGGSIFCAKLREHSCILSTVVNFCYPYHVDLDEASGTRVVHT